MENNYDFKKEFKKPWIQISILFIMLHFINSFILLPSMNPLKHPLAFFIVSSGAMIISFLIVVLYPKFSKHREQFSENNLIPYRKICSSMFVVLNFIFLFLMLLYSNAIYFSPLNIVLLVSAISHLTVGVTFTKLTPNRLIGLKFPWLLSNESAWKKTHRISAYIWIAFGLIGVALGLGQQVNEYMVLASFLPTVISLFISLLVRNK
ncbi:SdpI family protein [Paenibacillus sp. NRS-1781]|uniref:SdpI family protein n=1 Tax=unclassified Paenibacillus TaxID=185978 RepID=UPI003D288C05